MRGRLGFSAGVILLAVGLLTACQALSTASARPAPASQPKALRVGDVAPNFTLQDQNRQDVSLSDFRGKTVQLAFYVWAFSGG